MVAAKMPQIVDLAQVGWRDARKTCATKAYRHRKRYARLARESSRDAISGCAILPRIARLHPKTRASMGKSISHGAETTACIHLSH